MSNNKQINVHWLVHDGNLVERKPKHFVGKNVKIGQKFDETLLENSRTSLWTSWPENVSVEVVGSEPMDLVLCSPYVQIVSKRAKQIIERESVSNVEFLPIEIRNLQNNSFEKTSYWVLHLYELIDALDWNNTNWTVSPPPERDDPLASLYIIKPVFFHEKIQNIDLFRFEIVGEAYPAIYLSNRLKKILCKEKCTIGMDFCPIRTT